MSGPEVFVAIRTAAAPALVIVPGCRSYRFRSVAGALRWCDNNHHPVKNRAAVEAAAAREAA